MASLETENTICKQQHITCQNSTVYLTCVQLGSSISEGSHAELACWPSHAAEAVHISS